MRDGSPSDTDAGGEAHVAASMAGSLRWSNAECDCRAGADDTWYASARYAPLREGEAASGERAMGGKDGLPEKPCSSSGGGRAPSTASLGAFAPACPGVVAPPSSGEGESRSTVCAAAARSSVACTPTWATSGCTRAGGDNVGPGDSAPLAVAAMGARGCASCAVLRMGSCKSWRRSESRTCAYRRCVASWSEEISGAAPCMTICSMRLWQTT
mmetsp:Transcript_20220/g.54425  ORF Transcript_20220/g.54425 Transcript_20220/m.54425 type:complete len:213 (+) Transcript_20220:468-1106(+)